MKLKFYGLISASLISFIILQTSVSSKAINIEAKSYAKITKLSGQVKILDNNKWYVAKKNGIIKTNNQVKTLKNSRAELTFSDGSRLRLEQNTDIIFIRPKKSENSFFKIFTGRLWANIINRGKNRVAVQSSTAALAVMGTTFDVDAEKSKTDISVFDGSVGIQLPSVSIDTFDDKLKDLKLEIDDKHNSTGNLKPEVIEKPVHEIEKPVKVVPGPYQVSLDKWLEVVENQKITISDDKNATVSQLKEETVNNDEWFKWNKELDANTSENVLFN